MKPTKQEIAARQGSVEWYVAELTRLAQVFEENAKEDRQEAEDERDSHRKSALVRAASVADYAAEQCRRILDGKTWDERFVEMAKRSARPRGAKR